MTFQGHRSHKKQAELAPPLANTEVWALHCSLLPLPIALPFLQPASAHALPYGSSWAFCVQRFAVGLVLHVCEL